MSTPSDGRARAEAPEDRVRDLLIALRDEQTAAPSNAPSTVRFTVEHTAPPSDREIASVLSRQFGIEVGVEALFAGNALLARFRLLLVKGVSRPDRADLYEMADAFRRVLGAQVVEPDIGSSYFECECEPPHAGAPESADWAAWCWADPAKDKPADPNWAIVKSRIPEAWSFSRERGVPAQGDGILVFQPDTGVVPSHSEIRPDTHKHPAAANFVEDGAPPVDSLESGANPGHGTGTASVVASPEDGALAGAAPLATLVPIRCITSVAVFDQSPVARAIDHASRHGAHVITLSLGGVMSRALHAALQEAVRRQVIVIAAAGNCVEEVVWPARYAEVIAVGGINEASAPWRGSCAGPAVAICAPAELVARADARHQSGPLAVSAGQGTSFAAAITAGIAALWLAHHGRDALLALLPEGKTLQSLFRSMLMETARTPPGFDTERYGRGIVDALALLQKDPKTYAQAGEGVSDRQADPQRDLLKLMRHAYGGGAVEATAAALEDAQHLQEMACAALDRLRFARTLRAHVESLPPPLLSASLRRKLGGSAAALR